MSTSRVSTPKPPREASINKFASASVREMIRELYPVFEQNGFTAAPVVLDNLASDGGEETVSKMLAVVTKENGFVSRAEIVFGTMLQTLLLLSGGLEDAASGASTAQEGFKAMGEKVDAVFLPTAKKIEKIGSTVEDLAKMLAKIDERLSKVEAPAKLEETVSKAVSAGFEKNLAQSVPVPVVAQPAPIDIDEVVEKISKSFADVAKMAPAVPKAKKSRPSAAERRQKLEDERAALAAKEAARLEKKAAALRGKQVYSEEEDAAFRARLEKKGKKFVPLAERAKKGDYLATKPPVSKKDAAAGKPKTVGKFTPAQTAEFIKKNFTDKGLRYFSKKEREAFRRQNKKGNSLPPV